MFAKRVFTILAVFVLGLYSVNVCYAENDTVLYQAYAWEQNIDVFIASDMDSENLTCKVSNQAAEIVGSGLLADRDITVRTTILLDTSTSMPSQTREEVKMFIDKLIHDMRKNEQYKIVVFDEYMTVLQDYTSDRYELDNAADKIQFDGQLSKIYDAIYKTIPKVEPIDDAPCYYRTIVITDGVDDTESGITKEELYIKLQTDRYPIDVVAVSKTKQNEAEKELSAITRMSNGRYLNLYPESDLETIASNIGVDDIFWVRAIIPETLLDGSIRQFNITDGISPVQFDTKVPVFDVQVEEAQVESKEQENTSPSSTAPVTDIPSKPTETPPAQATSIVQEEDLGLLVEYTNVIYIVIGSVLILVTATIIAIIVIRKKKKRKTLNKDLDDNSIYEDRTVLISSNPLANSNRAPQDSGLCIRLRNIENPDKIWTIPLSDIIVVGRNKNCQVCIDDLSISRQQCKIYLENNTPLVENISKSNITQLNGKQLTDPRPLNEGDKIKCGRVTLMVDSLYGSRSFGNLNEMTEYVNV